MSFSLQVCLICEHKTVPDVEVSRVPYWWASYPVGMKHRTIQSKVKAQRRGIQPKQNLSGTGVFEPIPNGSLGGNGEDRTLINKGVLCAIDLRGDIIKSAGKRRRSELGKGGRAGRPVHHPWEATSLPPPSSVRREGPH